MSVCVCVCVCVCVSTGTSLAKPSLIGVVRSRLPVLSAPSGERNSRELCNDLFTERLRANSEQLQGGIIWMASDASLSGRGVGIVCSVLLHYVP